MTVTEPLRAEHRQLLPRIELLRAAADSGALDDQQRRLLRQLLYGLPAVVGPHFIKEEEIYLPELDRAMAPGRGPGDVRADGTRCQGGTPVVARVGRRHDPKEPTANGRACGG